MRKDDGTVVHTDDETVVRTDDGTVIRTMNRVGLGECGIRSVTVDRGSTNTYPNGSEFIGGGAPDTIGRVNRGLVLGDFRGDFLHYSIAACDY